MERLWPKDSVSSGQTGITFSENILKCCDVRFLWPTICPQSTKRWEAHTFSHRLCHTLALWDAISGCWWPRRIDSIHTGMWEGFQGDVISVSRPNSIQSSGCDVLHKIKPTEWPPKNWCKETRNHFRESRMKFQIQVAHNKGRRKETETKDRGHRKATKMIDRCPQMLTLRSVVISLKP